MNCTCILTEHCSRLFSLGSTRLSTAPLVFSIYGHAALSLLEHCSAFLHIEARVAPIACCSCCSSCCHRYVSVFLRVSSPRALLRVGSRPLARLRTLRSSSTTRSNIRTQPTSSSSSCCSCSCRGCSSRGRDTWCRVQSLRSPRPPIRLRVIVYRSRVVDPSKPPRVL